MRKFSLSVLLFAGSFLSAQTEQKIVAGDLSHEARVIPYNKRTIADISSQIRTEVAIVLPDVEKVIAVTCGDAGDMGNWITVWSPDSNVVVVKPAKQGITTSLNIQSNHGIVYTFAIHEVSLVPGAHADLKVYIEPGDQVRQLLDQPPRYVDAKVAESYKQDAAAARAELDTTRKQAEASVSRAKAETQAKYPEQLKFNYNFDRSKKAPFTVSAIYHDERFTYIVGDFPEPPAIYETKDGQPALVSYEYEDGRYIIRKIVDQGTLRVGKKQMSFAKQVS